MSKASKSLLMHRKQERQRANLPQFAKTLIDLADETASLDLLTMDERDELRDWREQLILSVSDLVSIIATYEAMHMGVRDWREPFNAQGLMNLDVALTAAFKISSRAIKNPTSERLTREAKRASAAYATEARRAQSRIVDGLILSFCRQSLRKNPKLTANALAAKHQDEINDALKAKGMSTLKQDAIRKRITELRTSGRFSN